MANPRFRSTQPSKALIELCRLPLAEGFRFLDQPAPQRVLKDHRIAPPKGLALFQREYRLDDQGTHLQCSCGRKATHFAATRHPNDKVSPFVMNLFAGTVLLTQDHIVPKSLDGSHHVDNMRVMCEPCNGKRGNRIALVDLLHGALFPKAVASPQILDRSLTDLLNDARRGWWPVVEPKNALVE